MPLTIEVRTDSKVEAQALIDALQAAGVPASVRFDSFDRTTVISVDLEHSRTLQELIAEIYAAQ